MKSKGKLSFMTVLIVMALMVWEPPAISQPVDDSVSGGTESAEPMVAKDVPEFATELTALPSEAVISFWNSDKNLEACVERGGPINIDEYLRAATDLIKAKKDFSLIGSLRNLMTCQQLEYMNENMCKADKVIEEPFFTKQNDAATIGKSLTKEEKQKMEGLIGEAEKKCRADTFSIAIIRGDKVLWGDDIKDIACSQFADLLDLKTDCEKIISILIDALDKSDPVMCNSIGKSDGVQFCELLTKKDPEICSVSSKSLPPEERDRHYKQCIDQLTAFKILRGIPLNKADKLNNPNEALAIAVNYSKNNNYCDTIYREDVIRGFCRNKDIIANQEAEKKEQEFMKLDHTRMKAEEEAKIRAEEEAKKRLKEEKK